SDGRGDRGRPVPGLGPGGGRGLVGGARHEPGGRAPGGGVAMATKTDRILGYLPGTFLAAADPSALRAVAGAAGGELQRAENSLAAVMRAHWVDHADRGAPAIDDLARLAALYGLAPRPDEGVEAFREHLKRFV